MSACTACGGRGQLPAERRVTSGGTRKTLPATSCNPCGGTGQIADGECPHGDDPQSCPACQPAATALATTATVLATSTAMTATSCGACDEPIRVGDPIALTNDGPPWIHQECQ